MNRLDSTMKSSIGVMDDGKFGVKEHDTFSANKKLTVYSAGTNPSSSVHLKAVQAMQEVGIDISGGKPEDVAIYLDQFFEYVITVCGNAKKTISGFNSFIAFAYVKLS